MANGNLLVLGPVQGRVKVDVVGTWWYGGVEAIAGEASPAEVRGQPSTGEGGARMEGRRVGCEWVMSAILPSGCGGLELDAR
jgi:hypothetical protein